MNASSEIDTRRKTRGALNSSWERRSRRISAVACASVVTLGLGVLLGWVFDIAFFYRIYPSPVTMKANTAILFIVLGVGLWLAEPTKSNRARRIGRILGLVVACAGAATLAQYVFATNFGIDELLLRDPSGTGYPGRMASATALNFVLLGFAVFFQGAGRRFRVSESAVLLAATISLVAVCGYIYGAYALIGIGPYSSMALHTALGFLASCCAFLFARPKEGIVGLLTSDTDAGRLLRALVPAIILGPIIIGWFRLQGEIAGYYDAPFGVALMVLSTVVLLTLFTSVIAASLHRSQLSLRADITARKQAEEALRASEERLRLAQQVARVGTFEWNIETGVNTWTPELEAMYGLPAGGFAGTQPAWENLVHPDDRAEAVRCVEHAFETGLPGEGEWRVVWPDESVHWLAGRWQVFKDASGRPLRLTGINIDITERKRAEQRLRESEQRFRQMADQAPVMIWISGVDKLCTWFNRPWLDFTGRTLEQELGNGWSEGVHPEDLAQCLETYVTSFEGNLPFKMEYRLRRHDGQWRWLFDNGIPRYQENGAFAGYIGSCIDVTDLKQTEEALRKSESLLEKEAAALAGLNDSSSRLWHMQNLQEGLDEILTATMRLVGADMGHIQTLDAGRGVLVISTQRGFGQEFLDFFREVSAEDNSACGRALRARERIVIEDVDADPLFMPLKTIAMAAGFRAVQSTLLISRDGTPLGMLSTHWRSPHRPTEQDLRRLDLYARQASNFIERCRTEEMLRQRESQMRAILNTATDGIITINLDGIIVSANPASERLFGYAQGELVGQSIGLLMPAPHRDDHRGYIRRYLQTREARIIGIGREVVGLRKDGSTFSMDLGVSEVEHLGLFTGIVRDISERKQAERDLDQYRSNLRTIASELLLTEERERRRLAGDLHDGLLQALLLSRLKLNRLSIAEPDAREVVTLLDDIEKMMRTVMFELSPPMLHELGLRHALRSLARDMQQRYSLSVQVEDDGQDKPLDERVAMVLFRLVRELLINVAKHAQTDRASVSLRRLDHTLQVEVEDHGRGFDPSEQSGHVKAGHFGLFSIRERLEYVGGTFKIRSAPGEGATMTLTAPLAAKAATAAVDKR